MHVDGVKEPCECHIPSHQPGLFSPADSLASWLAGWLAHWRAGLLAGPTLGGWDKELQASVRLLVCPTMAPTARDTAGKAARHTHCRYTSCGSEAEMKRQMRQRGVLERDYSDSKMPIYDLNHDICSQPKDDTRVTPEDPVLATHSRCRHPCSAPVASRNAHFLPGSSS